MKILPKPPEKAAVIYARYSSENQRDVSIEQQVADIQAFAKREGYAIVKVYADRHISGTTDDRPQFQQMLKDSAKGTFGAVLIWKTDRFARNRYDSATYKYKLRQNGVRVVSAMENVPDSPEGILLESVLEGQAEYYSASLAQNVKRGLNYNAQRCMAIGRRPFGYRNVEGYWQVDEDEAETVRMIFQKSIDGHGARYIAKLLNALGIKTAAGNEWCDQCIRVILKNEIYIGVYRYGDIKTENAVPAIVDRATFGAAQEAMASRNKCGTHSRSVGGVQRYLLSGKAVCGLCGRPMTGRTSGRKAGADYRYYLCSGKGMGYPCPMAPVRADLLEAEVIGLIQTELLMPDRANAIVDAMLKAHKPAESAAVIDGLQAQLEDRTAAIQNILKAIEAGAWSPALNDRLADLEREKLEIEAAIREAEGAKADLDREDLLAALARFAAGDVSDQEYRLQLVNALVDRVIVYPDKTFKVEIRFDKESGEGSHRRLTDFAPNGNSPKETSSTRIIATAGLVTILGRLKR